MIHFLKKTNHGTWQSPIFHFQISGVYQNHSLVFLKSNLTNNFSNWLNPLLWLHPFTCQQFLQWSFSGVDPFRRISQLAFGVFRIYEVGFLEDLFKLEICVWFVPVGLQICCTYTCFFDMIFVTLGRCLEFHKEPPKILLPSRTRPSHNIAIYVYILFLAFLF